jgi:hypothetical protein
MEFAQRPCASTVCKVPRGVVFVSHMIDVDDLGERFIYLFLNKFIKVIL